MNQRYPDEPNAAVDGPDLSTEQLAYVKSHLASLSDAAQAHTDACCAAFRSFYQTYHPMIRRMSFHLGISKEGLEECVQETWIRLIRNLARFQYRPEICRFETWLFVIVRSQVAHHRRLHRGPPTESLSNPVTAARLRHVADQSESFDGPSQLIANAISLLCPDLPEQSQQILRMKWRDDKPIPEIASQLSLSPHQVSVTLNRLNQRLASLIKQQALLDE